MKSAPRPRSGFTLLEVAISLAIFAVLGVSLATSVEMANGSQRTVYSVAAESRALRESSTRLTDELRTSTDAEITVTTLADSNSQVEFRVPVESGGNLLWGVYDKRLGATYDAQNKVGWRLRYTVRRVTTGPGVIERQLVRQILNTASTVWAEDVIAEGLPDGTGATPGFRVVKSGDMWVVTVSTVGKSASSPGIKAVFHVQARN